MLGMLDGVMRGSGGEEVCGDELGALVHELVEGVLAVGPGCAPDDGLCVGEGGALEWGLGLWIGREGWGERGRTPVW